MRIHAIFAALLLIAVACSFKARESHDKGDHSYVEVDASGKETTYESKSKETREKVDVKPSKFRKDRKEYGLRPDGGTYVKAEETVERERGGATKFKDTSEASDAGTGKDTAFHVDAGHDSTDKGTFDWESTLGFPPWMLGVGLIAALVILACAVAFFIRKKA